jgi:hypothetical protein
MCEEGLGARMGTSAASRGMLPALVFVGALKGNSPASLVDKGEPVGADRMILGAPSEGEGLCMSCVSFLVCPNASGGSSRPESSVLPDTAGDLDRGLRAMGEELLEPTMMATRKKLRDFGACVLPVMPRWGRLWLLASWALYSHSRQETCCRHSSRWD